MQGKKHPARSAIAVLTTWLVFSAASSTAAETAKQEVKLSGEYKAMMDFKKPVSVIVNYGAQIREGGYLSINAASEFILRLSDDTPKEGSTKFQVTGMCDIFGSLKEPTYIRSLNAGKFIVGDTTHRDDLKPGPVLTSFRMRYTVVVDTPFAIRDGNVNIEECVFVNSPVTIDGGRQVIIQKCTFVNPDGTGLEISRSDTYPNVAVSGCAFTDSGVGLSIKLGTMREKRAPVQISDCNFFHNGAHVFYEDLVHFMIQSCWMSEPPATNTAAFSYPADAQYKGRIQANNFKKTAIAFAGASLVKDGTIKPLDLITKPEPKPEPKPEAPQPPPPAEEKK